MLVVTGGALVLTVVLVFFAVSAIQNKHASDAAAEEAKAKQALAEKQNAEAQETLRQLANDIKEQDKRLGDAEATLKTAQNKADRDAAQANLDKLRQQKFEMEKRQQAAQAAAAKAERAKGVHISKECLDNPLAKGCS
jgi:septal ring factor EnvC (AmiA/AmiB activator)